jgi:hypothetical protein
MQLTDSNPYYHHSNKKNTIKFTALYVKQEDFKKYTPGSCGELIKLENSFDESKQILESLKAELWVKEIEN